MARIELIDPDETTDPAVRSIIEWFESEGKPFSNHFRVEAHIPDVLEHMLRARIALWRSDELATELLEKIAIAISITNGCRYCTGAYCTMLSHDAETDEVVDEFLEQFKSDDLPPFERDVIEFAVQVAADFHAIADDDIDSLKTEHDLSDETLVRIIYVVNIVSGYNRIATVFDVDYDHDYPKTLADGAF